MYVSRCVRSRLCVPVEPHRKGPHMEVVGRGPPNISAAVIPKANSKGQLSRGTGGRNSPFFLGHCSPGVLRASPCLFPALSFPIVPGWVDAELRKRAPCVDATPTPSPGWGVGGGVRASSAPRGHPARRGLTWQSTIILSLGSSSPAPGRGPGLAEAARLGRRAAQGGARLGGSWRGLQSTPGLALRGPCCRPDCRQRRSHCLRRAAPPATRAPPLGSARAPGARAGWAGTARPRPGPA
jgi:hypothetical protein